MTRPRRLARRQRQFVEPVEPTGCKRSTRRRRPLNGDDGCASPVGIHTGSIRALSGRRGCKCSGRGKPRSRFTARRTAPSRGLGALARRRAIRCTEVPDSGPVHAGQQPAPALAIQRPVNPRGPVAVHSPRDRPRAFRCENSDTTDGPWCREGRTRVDGAVAHTWRHGCCGLRRAAGRRGRTGRTPSRGRSSKSDRRRLRRRHTYKPSPSGPQIAFTIPTRERTKGERPMAHHEAPANLVGQWQQSKAVSRGYVYFLRLTSRAGGLSMSFSREPHTTCAALMTTLLARPAGVAEAADESALHGGTAPDPLRSTASQRRSASGCLRHFGAQPQCDWVPRSPTRWANGPPLPNSASSGLSRRPAAHQQLATGVPEGQRLSRRSIRRPQARFYYSDAVIRLEPWVG